MINGKTERIVKQARDSGAFLSRNRNFDLFDTAEGRRAHRIIRRLKSLEKDLLDGHDKLKIRTLNDESIKLEIHFSRIDARRIVRLSRYEMKLLLESKAGPIIRSSIVSKDKKILSEES